MRIKKQLLITLSTITMLGIAGIVINKQAQAVPVNTFNGRCTQQHRSLVTNYEKQLRDLNIRLEQKRNQLKEYKEKHGIKKRGIATRKTQLREIMKQNLEQEDQVNLQFSASFEELGDQCVKKIVKLDFKDLDEIVTIATNAYQKANELYRACDTKRSPTRIQKKIADLNHKKQYYQEIQEQFESLTTELNGISEEIIGIGQEIKSDNYKDYENKITNLNHKFNDMQKTFDRQHQFRCDFKDLANKISQKINLVKQQLGKLQQKIDYFKQRAIYSPRSTRYGQFKNDQPTHPRKLSAPRNSAEESQQVDHPLDSDEVSILLSSSTIDPSSVVDLPDYDSDNSLSVSRHHFPDEPSVSGELSATNLNLSISDESSDRGNYED